MRMTTPSADSDVQAVLEADSRRIAALVAGDVATVDALTAEDYTHVETGGGQRSKAEFMDALKRPGFRFVRWIIDENHVRLFGDVAVVTGRYRNVVRTSAGE